jgi:hypothetical protein
MKPRSSLEAAYGVLNVPITPVSIQPAVERPLPNAGSDIVHGTSSVRDNSVIRQETTKPVATPQDRVKNAQYAAACAMRAQAEERKKREDERYQTVRL